MASRISIPNLLTSNMDTQTVSAEEVEVRPEAVCRPHTPPAEDLPLPTNITCHQIDVESPDTTSHATSVRQLLASIKLTSTGEPTLEDMYAMQAQSSAVTDFSMALQQQMFDGFGSLGPQDYLSHMLPPPYCCSSFECPLSLKSLGDQQLLAIPSLDNYNPDFILPNYNYYCGWCPGCASSVCEPLGDSALGSYVMDSSCAEAYFTGAILGSGVSGVSGKYTSVEPFQPGHYGSDAQHVGQMDVLLGNGDNWDVSGDQRGLLTVPTPFFPGYKASSDS
ncbi:uncharacterized protein CTRU02_214368 [Colletotrichum truncatum]|uniref:Uncharacterized protein n=1 Tax=Colletotrichum truncatum TaxID=5467 RepID=A0ACC3YEK0_COLTU|nr:uncharacterized protein CTRU02_13527 [Colletotrichum truncatum]KAF6783291.1 hypothetical protein CTRU02_13527 [Colletotrichum truncatum]